MVKKRVFEEETDAIQKKKKVIEEEEEEEEEAGTVEKVVEGKVFEEDEDEMEYGSDYDDDDFDYEETDLDDEYYTPPAWSAGPGTATGAGGLGLSGILSGFFSFLSSFFGGGVSTSTPSSSPSSTSSSGTPSPVARQARPDRQIPLSTAQVYQDYDTKLMQTVVGGPVNSNKFYIIQVLVGDGAYWAWNRWGRLGETGQNKLTECKTIEMAIKLFEDKFKDKTKNRWQDRDRFVKHDGKYQLVEIDPSDDGSSGGGDAALGRLSKSQIEKGQQVLAQVKDLLDSGDGKKTDFSELSSQFYSLIPTTTGRANPPPLNNYEILNAKKAQLEFWLRMGFDDMTENDGLTPIDGVMDLPLPDTLEDAARGVCDRYSVKLSQHRAKKLVSRNAGSPVKPMGVELYASILLYTSDALYAELNRVLRSEDRRAAKKYFPYLRMFLEAMGCMPPQKRALWRGISVDLHDQYEPGKVITWWNVSSCTADEQVARNFMSGCGGSCTLLTIQCETAMDVSSLSFYSNEKESLLAPGTQLRVISRKRSGKVSEIHMEEVGRALN